uniref:Uncharacterized protein n=1 Tax=Arundo donax TaxID=35708 RepID=A0A0A8YLZ2_ARUDO
MNFIQPTLQNIFLASKFTCCFLAVLALPIYYYTFFY